ncbi:Acyl-CoA carboxylase epsilon subunit [Curtobacterium sp. UNCCL20]|uniref:acyl-CoA carboxylase subunit epsilon n=1 Tax=Curtobacterium sp. UNCCL20 TaxID=1502773 RepID=UPI00088534C4|nr:acyl-CoA carboxylase subunit epsilon [Curtobacterium sp. UNCCL20]SDQ72797.1 Acyl-CoA carboxylase epsilon subunit [Curtobacterium sp. UNCCL20]
MGRHAAPVPADEGAEVGAAVGADEHAAVGADEHAELGADVRVVSGDPTPEELAAVIAVLQRQADEAAANGRAEVTVSPRSGWDVSARGLRRPLEHGVGAWTRSLR